MTHFVLIALGVGITVATVPVIAELAMTTAAFLLRKRPLSSSAIPSTGLALAVIVPAHNEESSIAETIESLRASAAFLCQSTGSAVRILAVAHNCSDRTAAQAAGAGAEVLVYNDPAARGKGFALRYGFERVFSQGAEAALVVDADSTVSANLIGEVCEALSAGAGAVQCRYEMTSPQESAKGRLAALAFRGFNFIRPAGRARMGLSAGILGNGFAISKTVFNDVPYQALSLVEDLEYHIYLLLAGKRVQFLDRAQALSPVPTTAAGAATQRSRWEGGRFRAARVWLGPLAGRIARGQIRLLEPFLDLAGLPLSYAASLLVLALLLPVPWLRWYAAGALAIFAGHVLTAASAGSDFRGDLQQLSKAPAYIAWKLLLLPRLLRGSGTDSAWIRTERTPAGGKLPGAACLGPQPETRLAKPSVEPKVCTGVQN